MMRALHDRSRGDDGMTMVELLITSSVLVILLGMVLTSVTLINDVSTNVSSQYQEFDQALPALTPFHTLLAAQIEPGPTVASVPNPPFPVPGSITLPAAVPSTSIGNFAMVFFANVGSAYSNTVSCPTGQSTCPPSTAGPALIVAEELDPSGVPVTSSTVCSASTPCSLQVRMYLPNLGPSGSPTCPLQWGAVTEPGPCTYPSNYTLVANVQDVVNNPSAVAADGVTPTQPIFSYDFTDPNMPAQSQQSIALTATEVQNSMMTGLSGAAYGYPSDTQSLNTCAAPGSSYPTAAIACPADAIGSVGLDLMVAKSGASAQGTVENSLVIYRYAASPGSSTAPYQYSETQG